MAWNDIIMAFVIITAYLICYVLWVKSVMSIIRMTLEALLPQNTN